MRKVTEICDLCGTSFDFDFALKKAGVYLGEDTFTNTPCTTEYEVCPNCLKKIKLELQETFNKTTESLKTTRYDGFV